MLPPTKRYQENLDTIKEEGSVKGTDKPSKVPKRSSLPSLPPSSGRFRSKGIPDYTLPFQSDSLGDNQYDESTTMALPESIWELPPEMQSQIYAGELAESRAQNQTNFDKFSKSYPRYITKALSEVAKGIGFIGSLPFAAAEGELDVVINNMFINKLNEFDEYYDQEMFPVHTRREILNGTFSRQVWSPEFWAREGADAAGFMASSIVAGMGMNAALKGAASVTSKIIANQAAKAAVKGGISNIGKVAKFINKGATNEATRMISTAMAQSYIESMAESNGSNMEFERYWEQFDNGDGTYTRENSDGTVDNLTAEDIKRLKGELLSTTFGLNAIVTFLPNLFVSKALFGAKGESNSILRALGLKGLGQEAAKKGLKAASKRASLKLLTGIPGPLGEAAQEGAQHAIQIYGELKTQELEDINLVDGLVDGMYDAFGSVEGQKAMFLGGIMGLGPGIKESMSNYHQFKKDINDVGKLIENDWINLGDAVKEHTIEDPKTGKLKLNPEKLFDDFRLAEKDIKEGIKLEVMQEQGLPIQYRNQLAKMIIEKAFPFFNMDGGTELALDIINNQIVDELVESSKPFGFSSKEEYRDFVTNTIEEAKRDYDQAQKDGPTLRGVDLNRLKAVAKEDVEALLMLEQIVGQYDAQYAIQKTLKNYNVKQLEEVDSQLNTLISEVASDYAEVFPEGKAESTEMKIRSLNGKKIYTSDLQEYKGALIKKATFESLINKAQKKLNSLTDSKTQEEIISYFEDKKIAEEKRRETFEQGNVLQEELKKGMIEKGYFVNEKDLEKSFEKNPYQEIPVKDKNGNFWALSKVKYRDGNIVWALTMYDNETGKMPTEISEKKNSLPLNPNTIKALGINKDSLVFAEEFSNWATMSQIKQKNKVFLEKIAGIILFQKKQREEYNKKLRDDIYKLAEIENKLDLWKNKNAGITEVNTITDAIAKLESQRASLNTRIKETEKALDDILNAIVFYEAMMLDIQNKIDKTFDPNNYGDLLFQSLVKELKETDNYSKSIVHLEEMYLQMDKDLTNLYTTKEELENTLDALYSLIERHLNFADILNDPNLNTDSLRRYVYKNMDWILENYPEIIKNPGQEDVVINYSSMKNLISDPATRKDFLRTINTTIKNLPIEATELEIAETKKKISSLSKTFSIIKDSLPAYIKTKELLSLITEEEAEKIIQERQEKVVGKNGQRDEINKRVEQESTPDPDIVTSLGAKKSNENKFSTTTGYYMDWVEQTPHEEGNQSKQAKNWSKTLQSINVKDIDLYSINIVNAAGLKEMGGPEVGGMETGTELYAVLMKEGKPVKTNQSHVVAGIPEVDKLFPKNANENTLKLNIKRDPAYREIIERDEVKPITTENPWRGFTSKEQAINDFIEKEKKEYAEWRDKIETLAEEGPVNRKATSISKGWLYKSNEAKENRTKPADAGITKVVVGQKYITLEDGSSIAVVPGMPYGKIKESGHAERLYNYKIGDLEGKEKDDMINTILSMMGLVKYAGLDGKKAFTLKDDKKNGKMTLFGGKNKIGAMDYFINWNAKDKAYNIHYSVVKGKPAYVFSEEIDGNIVETFIDVELLFDKEGNPVTIKSQHPKVQKLISFLENKYLNVVHKQTNQSWASDKPRAFRMPLGYEDGPLGEKVIKNKFVKNYDKFILDNYVYTNAPAIKKNPVHPRYINQYVIFDKDQQWVKPEKDQKQKLTKNKQSDKIVLDAEEQMANPFIEPEIKDGKKSVADFFGIAKGMQQEEKSQEEKKEEKKESCKKSPLNKKKKYKK